jgi:hypothetical protein
MALGTITIKALRETLDGGQELLIEFLGDDAYAAGGTPNFNSLLQAAIKAAHGAASDANVRGEESVECVYVVPQRAGALVPSYDYDADKLFVYDNATDLENATADISGVTFECVAVCK